MEATLKIGASPIPLQREGAIELPPSWYIQYNSEADRQREVELSNLPAVFYMFDD